MRLYDADSTIYLEQNLSLQQLGKEDGTLVQFAEAIELVIRYKKAEVVFFIYTYVHLANVLADAKARSKGRKIAHWYKLEIIKLVISFHEIVQKS